MAKSIAFRAIPAGVTLLAGVGDAASTRATTPFGPHRKLPAVERGASRNQRAIAGLFSEELGHSGERVRSSLTQGVRVLRAERQNTPLDQEPLQSPRSRSFG
jgi:hypothetical protein